MQLIDGKVEVKVTPFSVTHPPRCSVLERRLLLDHLFVLLKVERKSVVHHRVQDHAGCPDVRLEEVDKVLG